MGIPEFLPVLSSCELNIHTTYLQEGTRHAEIFKNKKISGHIHAMLYSVYGHSSLIERTDWLLAVNHNPALPSKPIQRLTITLVALNNSSGSYYPLCLCISVIYSLNNQFFLYS